MELDKQTMEAVRNLAEINSQISLGKAELFGIKNDLEKFLDERGRLETERLQGVLAQSEGLVVNIGANYKFIEDYYNQVKSFAGFLAESHEKLHQTVVIFEQAKEKWEKKLDKGITKLSLIELNLRNQEKDIRERVRVLNEREQELRKGQGRLNSQQEALKKALSDSRK